jgi:hypothetical protein
VNPAPILAHGIGGRLDLPVPTSFFVAGAGVVLVVSFVALALLWPRPRLQGGPVDRPINLPLAGPLWAAGRVLGVAGLLLVIVAGLTAVLAGTDVSGARNIAPVLVWVGFWLLVPFLGAVVGNLYSSLNPWRTLAGWSGVGDNERPHLIGQIGIWPGVVALVAFTWMELVWPDSAAPGSLAIAALLYTTYLFLMMGFWGRETALTSADAFTSYNRMLSSISPFGRSAKGRLMWRGWLRALPVLPEWKGLWAFVVAMIGTVSFDGFSATEWYRSGLGNSMLLGTAGLLAVVLIIAGGYWLACWGASRLGGGLSTTKVAARFAHTLVPIALAYAFAHYFTLILFEGQQVISAISDPFGLGWDLFGTRGYRVNFFLGPEPVWYIQVGVIIAGHVAGVVLAHDRALADFAGAAAVRSQYAMLILMVFLTGLGLVILAG